MNRPSVRRAVRWEAALGSCRALSLALLPLACSGQTADEPEGAGGAATGGETGSGESGGSDAIGSGGFGGADGGSTGDGGTGTCDVLDQVLNEGTSTTEPPCELATAPGLGFIAPDEWSNLEELVATDEGLWVAGYSDAGGFVSALSLDGEAEVLLTLADGGVSALTLVGGDTLAVAGTISDDPEDSTRHSISLRRITLDGDELWTARFGSSSANYVAALAPGPGESVYVAGTAFGELNDSSEGTFLRKYDAEGNLEHHIDLDASGYLNLYDMAATDEGTVYIAIKMDTATSGVVRALVDDGEVLWELPSSLLGCSFCYELFAGADGDLYVAGQNYESDDMSLARVSPDGDVRWTSIVSHQNSESVGALTVTEYGAYLFGATFAGDDARNDALAVHFGPDGEQLSVTTRAGSTRNGLIRAAASTPAGDVFVAGFAGPGWSGSGEPRSFVMAWPTAP